MNITNKERRPTGRMVENMKKADLVLLKSGRYELNKAEDTTARKILFDRFMEDQYKMVMHHLRMAKDSEDFISRILEDPEMSGTYAYAYVSQNLRPSARYVWLPVHQNRI